METDKSIIFCLCVVIVLVVIILWMLYSMPETMSEGYTTFLGIFALLMLITFLGMAWSCYQGYTTAFRVWGISFGVIIMIFDASIDFIFEERERIWKEEEAKAKLLIAQADEDTISLLGDKITDLKRRLHRKAR